MLSRLPPCFVGSEEDLPTSRVLARLSKNLHSVQEQQSPQLKAKSSLLMLRSEISTALKFVLLSRRRQGKRSMEAAVAHAMPTIRVPVAAVESCQIKFLRVLLSKEPPESEQNAR